MKKLGTTLAAVAAALTLGLPAAVGAGEAEIVPIGQQAFGKSYGEWSAKWWNWAVSQPAETSPLTDETGARCGVNQSGPVFFLAGTTGGSATRSCTVPAGKGVLFPMINGDCSEAEGNGTTDAELRACAKDLMDHVTHAEATIDGVPVRKAREFRAASPLFTLNPVAGNPFGIPPGPTPCVADGFWILVNGLGRGAHTIEFRGVAVFPGFKFETAVSYNLTIA
jgi:hypothetical protein